MHMLLFLNRLYKKHIESDFGYTKRATSQFDSHLYALCFTAYVVACLQCITAYVIHCTRHNSFVKSWNQVQPFLHQFLQDAYGWTNSSTESKTCAILQHSVDCWGAQLEDRNIKDIPASTTQACPNFGSRSRSLEQVYVRLMRQGMKQRRKSKDQLQCMTTHNAANVLTANSLACFKLWDCQMRA